MRKKKECEGQMELDLVDQKDEKSSTGTKPKRKRVVKKEKDTDKETASAAKRTRTKTTKESAVSERKETAKKTTKKARPAEQGTASSGTTKKPRRKKTAEIYQISDLNKIKPGVGETTRVLLRRVPYKVLVNPAADKKYLQHILQLCNEKHIPVEEYPFEKYNVCGIIKTVADC